jgi:hypothetical protein
VKFIPRRRQIVGRIVVKKILSAIIRPDETKNTTKFVLIDALGPDAEAAGLKVGDLVMPKSMATMQFDGGASIRPIVDEVDVMGVVLDPGSLAMQNENCTDFVAIDSPEAAKSIGYVVTVEAVAA